MSHAVQVFVSYRWYRLNSKTGKKEKERGDIQVTVQFTRNNLTASMYDLVMKDKGVSTFYKLKERIKGKRRASEEDSSSAILPGGYGSLVRMRQRLPSDGGGEEYYEDDEGGEVRRSKMRTFFLRGKLRKSSDTRSSTSLGSESSESSSRGGSLSPTAGISVVVSDLSNSPSNSSNLTADNSPEHTANTSPKLSSPKCDFGDEAGEITIAVPQPKVCVNGSHSLSIQPLDSGKANLSPVDRDLPPCIMGDGRRWSFDKPDAEEKAAIAAALEQSGPMQGDPEEDSLGTASSCTAEADSQKQRRKDEYELASTEDKHRGWFGSKDSHNKPSHNQVVSSSDTHSPPLSWGSSVDSPEHLTNLLNPSQSSPPPLSRSNPFFTTVHNPFYKDMSCSEPLNPSPPPLPFLSSARPPITTLFPEVSKQTSTEDSSSDLLTKAKVETDEQTKLSKKMSNPFTSEQGLDSELDHSFDEFAAGRLQSPDDPTTDFKTQHNTSSFDLPLPCINKEPIKTDSEQTTNDSQYFQPMQMFTCLDNKDTHHFFTKLLDTIPENSLEHESKPISETQQISQVNADVFNSNEEISGQKFNSSSPDPSSSGLGSSAEEDVLSSFSSCSASDKLSSSEETEVQNFENSFEKKPEVKHLKTSESEEEFTDKSEDMSLDQQTVIEHNSKEAISSSSKQESTSSVTNLDTEIEKRNCHTTPKPQPVLKVEHGTLQRSLSEGVLTPASDDIQASSAFGSDPELTSSKPQPDLLLFSPFTPSLTPQCSSSPLALCPPPPVAEATTWRSPTQQQQQQAANQLDSPHPVKPLTTATAGEEKRQSQSTDDSDKKKSLTEGAGSYYHLTHTELVSLLVQREAELQRQKVEFERQKILLTKRETELKKLKPQVRDLEDYIDTLLVRIMEQKPTLLQVRSKFK
ncbi:hypothetical protein WMY93_016740 [Mugilogobius chulae]|uniref:FIP-RBD domain-containing protein n=1 Tax=Mugilogobius chulae TaxID=88201 RepID=A0AAW0NMF7_9GOBI